MAGRFGDLKTNKADEAKDKDVGKSADPNFTQLCVLVPKDLKKKLKMECLMAEEDMSTVVSRLLAEHLK